MRYVLLILWLWLPTSLSAQTEMTWLEPQDLVSHLRQNPKPVLVYLGADWCQYCGMMKARTFRDSSITHTLEKDYYAVYWDVEREDAVSFLGRQYQYQPTGPQSGYHELTVFFSGKKARESYPLLLLFTEDLELQARHSGFLSPEDFLLFIHPSP